MGHKRAYCNMEMRMKSGDRFIEEADGLAGASYCVTCVRGSWALSLITCRSLLGGMHRLWCGTTESHEMGLSPERPQVCTGLIRCRRCHWLAAH